MKKENISQRAITRTLGTTIKTKNIARWTRVWRTRTSSVSSRFGWDFFRMFDLGSGLGWNWNHEIRTIKLDEMKLDEMKLGEIKRTKRNKGEIRCKNAAREGVLR